MAKIYPTNVNTGIKVGPSWADDDRFSVNTEMIDKVMVSGAVEFIFEVYAPTSNITKAIADANAVRQVRIRCVDSLGNIHKWFNKTITTSITESGSGTVTNVTSCVITEGEGVIEIATAGEWTEGDTITMTVAEQAILGMTVLAKTNVATIVA